MAIYEQLSAGVDSIFLFVAMRVRAEFFFLDVAYDWFVVYPAQT